MSNSAHENRVTEVRNNTSRNINNNINSKGNKH